LCSIHWARISVAGGTEGEVIENGTCVDNDNTWGRMLGTRVYGMNDTNTSHVSGATYACIPDADHLRGDILVVRYQAPWIIGGLTTPNFEDDRLYLRSSLNKALLFKGKDEADLSNGLAGGRTSAMVSRAYYVGPSASGTCEGSAVPALFRESLDANGRPVAEEIAYGIDNFQVRYGVDLNGDGSVDQYFDAGDSDLDTVNEWGGVVDAQIWVLTRSECPETGFDNTGTTFSMGDIDYDPADTAGRGYRRQLYQTTVTLRNARRL